MEKRKIKFQRKIELIERARSYLEPTEFNWRTFREKEIYSRIRPYFFKEVLENIEGPDNIIRIQMGGGRGNTDHEKKVILDELG